jgi:hypothetical protein
MEALPTQESPSQRPPVGWRLGAAISGGLLAGALFVGAHADSLRLPLIDFTPFSQVARPVDVKTAQWAVRARATNSGSASSAQGASVASARQVSAGGGEGRIEWLDEPADKSDVIGETPNILELPSLDMAMGAAGLQSAAQLTSWPLRGMGGGGFAGGAGAGASMGSSPAQTPQKDAAAGGTDPAAEDNGLQPLMVTAVLDGPIPEPTTWTTIILGLGLAGVALRGFRRRAEA